MRGGAIYEEYGNQTAQKQMADWNWPAFKTPAKRTPPPHSLNAPKKKPRLPAYLEKIKEEDENN